MLTNERQEIVADWCRRSFGEASFRDHAERGRRVVEEAVELGQALGVPAEDAYAIVDHVYSRPAGSVGQEIAGTILALYCAAESTGRSVDAEAHKEVRRVLSYPPEHFAKKHAAKREAGISKL